MDTFKTSLKTQDIPENKFGTFCDVSKILDSTFNDNTEYEEILEELNILDNFQGKSEKRIILLRHFEDNKKKGNNEELTEKGLNIGDKKVTILKNYLKYSDTLIRYAGIGKNKEIVHRTSQTAELLVNTLNNISGIKQEYGLDSTYKNNDKKTRNLLYQEVKTIDFLERFKEEQNSNFSKDSEIWIVHKTNMDKILREILNIVPENKAFYGALDYGETVEFDMGFNQEEKLDFLKQDNSLIKLTNTNYLNIISELEESKNIPENIKNAIKYFNNGKIKIIDLQNVINKNISENNSFLEQFKNSNNSDLKKLSFINILKNNNLLDDDIEKLIIEDELDTNTIILLQYFSEIFNNYDEDINYGILGNIYQDFNENINKFFKYIKVIGILDSRKILNLKYLDELGKVFYFIREKEENNYFSEIDNIVENSVISNGFSNIFKEFLPEFKQYIGINNNSGESIFKIQLRIYNNGFEKGIERDIRIIRMNENGTNKKFNLYGNIPIDIVYQIHEDYNSKRFEGFFENETDFKIVNTIEQYVKDNITIEQSDLAFPYYITLKFIGNKLVLEKGNVVYNNTELKNKEFIELEELLQDGIFKGKITEEFKKFYNTHKEKEWFNRHIQNIIGFEIKEIYLEILEMVRKVDKKIDNYYTNNGLENYNLNRDIIINNSEEYKILFNTNDLKILKKVFYSKITFYNKLILQFLYPDYVDDGIYKIETIENIKGILKYIKD